MTSAPTWSLQTTLAPALFETLCIQELLADLSAAAATLHHGVEAARSHGAGAARRLPFTSRRGWQVSASRSPFLASRQRFAHLSAIEALASHLIFLHTLGTAVPARPPARAPPRHVVRWRTNVTFASQSWPAFVIFQNNERPRLTPSSSLGDDASLRALDLGVAE